MKDDIRTALLAPLPPEALKQHPTRSYLTTINAIYVTERFNDVFGLDGWKFRTEIVKDDGKWVVVQVFFTATTMMDIDTIPYEASIERSAFGGNDNEDVGDRYKGAVTDALTKIGSMLGVGTHVWKNENVPGRSARPTEHKSPEQVAQGSNTAVPQGEPEEWLNVLDKQGRFTTLGLEYAERVYAKEMTVKDIRKLFKLSRVNAEALENWRPTRPNPVGNSSGTTSETNQAQFDDDLPF
jgi:hypothetical protein